MILQEAIQTKTVKTASSIVKRTKIRKKISLAEEFAFSNVLPFQRYDDTGRMLIGSNLPHIIKNRSEDINSNFKYFNNIKVELDKIENVIFLASTDIEFDFSHFINKLQKEKNIPPFQLKQASKIIRLLINQNYREEIIFKYSIEKEILFIKNNFRGNHYIIIGDEIDDVSFAFVGTEIGEYSTLHFSSEVSINKIISEFING